MLRLFAIFPMMRIFLVPIFNCQFIQTSKSQLKLYENLLQSWLRLLFSFIYWCQKDLFFRSFIFSSSKELWTTPPKIWIFCIFYHHCSGYYFCIVESGWDISPLRRPSMCLNFSKSIFYKTWTAKFGFGFDKRRL